MKSKEILRSIYYEKEKKFSAFPHASPTMTPRWIKYLAGNERFMYLFKLTTLLFLEGRCYKEYKMNER